MIYHIVKEKDYLLQTKVENYLPENFHENGFVHCSSEESVISVANDYYSNVEDTLLLLKIDPEKLKSQTIYEQAVPEKGVGTKHISTALVFPHVYGPINNSAVVGIGILQKQTEGYVWPKKFVSPSVYLNKENDFI
jgi:uncharacterized protein (DUF952 family)